MSMIMLALDKLPTELLHTIAGYLIHRTSTGQYIKSPVCWAAVRNKIDILEKALKYGLDLGTAYSDSPLHCAARRGHDAVVNWLLDHGVPVNPTASQDPNGSRYIVPTIHSPLYTAIRARNDSTAKILLSRGARMWFREENTPEAEFKQAAIHIAAYYGLEETVLFLVMVMRVDVDEFDMNFKTPLDYAVRRAYNGPMIRTLLELGAATRTEQSPQLPVTTAIEWGNFANAMTLLQAGAEVNMSHTSLGILSPLGACALYIRGYTTRAGSEPGLSEQKHLFRNIISNGADVNAPCDGLETPLGIAVRRGSATAVYELIRGGADVEKCSGDDQLRPMDLIWDIEDLRDITIKGSILVAAGARLDVPCIGGSRIAAGSRSSLENAISGFGTEDSAIILDAFLCSADRRSFHDRYLDEFFESCIKRRLDGPAKILMDYGASSKGAKDAAYIWASEIVRGLIPDDDHRELLFCLDFRLSFEQIQSLFESALEAKDEVRCHLLLDRDILSLCKADKRWLHMAAEFGCFSLTRRLYRAGMDINALDDDFETPMMAALRADYSTIADLLFDLGADPFHPRPYAECRRSQSLSTEIISPFEYAVRNLHCEYAEKWWMDSHAVSLPLEDLAIPCVLSRAESSASFINRLRHFARSSSGYAAAPLSPSQSSSMNEAERRRFKMRLLGVKQRIESYSTADMLNRDWGAQWKSPPTAARPTSPSPSHPPGPCTSAPSSKTCDTWPRSTRPRASPVPPDSVFRRCDAGFAVSRETLREHELGLVARILGLGAEVGGAEVGGAWRKSNEEVVRVRELETLYFHPSREYVAAAMARPSVDAYMRATRRRFPVRSAGLGARAEVAVPEPLSGGVVGLGPRVAVDTMATAATAVEEADPFVLGYRATKIWYKRTGRSAWQRGGDEVKTEAYVNGATMAGDGNGGGGVRGRGEDDELEFIPDVGVDGETDVEIAVVEDDSIGGIEPSRWIQSS
ncbi:ankyrin repeat-containing domain protein [Daldinia bambusicola]|nr:ankyrin repeat-containing domain protein [Daldinia bambusicola]